jgi:hypothetical protein
MRDIGIGLTWARHGAAACHLTNQLPRSAVPATRLIFLIYSQKTTISLN